MKRIFGILFCVFLLNGSPGVYAQAIYETGSASISIEPDTAMYSAALAGYGVPREGRFSLRWDAVESGFEARSSVDTNVINGLRYDLDSSGNLIRFIRGKTKLVKGTRKFTALTCFQGALYATSLDGRLLKGKVKGRKIQWTALGQANGIISMTSDSMHLYALNQNDTLWRITLRDDGPDWLQLARRNELTYKPSLSRIRIHNNRLYARDHSGNWFVSRHQSQGNLKAHAQVIRQDERTAVLVGVDVCGLDHSFVQRVKIALKEQLGLPPEAVLINASHTHFAPVTQGWNAWQDYYHHPDTNYLYNVVQKGIVKAVHEAIAHSSPGKIYFSRGTTDIGHNRRAEANSEKPYDPTLDVLRIADLNGKTKSVVFITGCHPVFENKGLESFTLNANFPAVARRYVEEHTGADHALFIQGCAGDINPVHSSYKQTGSKLGADVLGLLGKDEQAISGPIAFFLDSMRIPVKPWSKEKIIEFKTRRMARHGDIEAEKDVRWANIMLERYANGTLVDFLPEWIQTFRIGQWKLIGLSREAVTEYGPAIRAIWPDEIVSVAGYSNDVSSYLPAGWHIEAGVYEGFGSFFWYGQPGIPPKDVLSRIVAQIRKNNR